MVIPMILNGKEVAPDIPPQKRLIEVLRNDFGLLKTRGDCYHGVCGRCIVIVDNQLAQACLLPVFKVKDKSIVTVEGMEKTTAYKRILQGFETGGFFPCNSCLGGRVLATHILLETTIHPSDEEILRQMSYSSCSCTNLEKMILGIRAAGRLREES